MLINFIDKGLEVISHPAHGLLTGKIAEQISTTITTDYWLETLTAIIEHDDEQLSPKQKNCISKTGMPLDFLSNELPTEKSLIHAKSVFDKVLLKSNWSAMILSHHLKFLYADAAKDSSEFQDFLSYLDNFRKSVYELYDVIEDDVIPLYQIMVFSDRLSLILCQNEVPELERKLEINKSIGGATFFVSQGEDGNFAVEPWIFKSDNFEIFINAKLLKEIKFDDEKEFTDALKAAPFHVKRWKFSKPSIKLNLRTLL